MLHYRIAGVRIGIEEVPGIPLMENFAPFLAPEGPVDINYRVVPYPKDASPVPAEDAMDLVSQDVVNRLYLSGGKLYKRVAMQEGNPRMMWFVQTVGDWDRATVYIPEDWLDYEGFGNVLSLEKTLLPYHALMLHCSLIEHEGRGIAFSAPSQTGKSTQANLWVKHRGAHILNGDRAIIRSEPTGIFAYGSPYAGTSGIYRDERVPLRAIVMLEQAKENSIREIPQAEGLGLFLSQSSLPIWEPTLFEMGMETLEAILTQVPMYMLSCLPDEGAVDCLYGALKEAGA